MKRAIVLHVQDKFSMFRYFRVFSDLTKNKELVNS